MGQDPPSNGRGAPSCLLALALAIAGALPPGGTPALAMIDPSFTPLHLVQDAELIVAGKLAAGTQGGGWTLAGPRALKGPKAGANVRLALDLPRAKDAAHARSFLRASLGARAVFFRRRDAAYLLVANVWARLKAAGANAWRVTVFDDQPMLKTYAGAADKLVEMTAYILRDKLADVPVAVGVTWRARIIVARLGAAVAGLACLADEQHPAPELLVASPAGDRLFAFDPRTRRFNDLTHARGLDTASRAFALVDLDRDGLADLVGWDGTRLHVRIRRPDRRFARLPALAATGQPTECTALAAISPIQDGTPGLLVTAPWPQLLTWTGKGWSIAPAPGDPSRVGRAAPGNPAIAADFDGDGYADVLQLRHDRSLLWRGKKAGLRQPVPCPVKTCGSPTHWSLGDFDTDGRLDLLLTGRRPAELWENTAAAFRPVIRYAGSLHYRNQPRAAACLATDLNHDGRPDAAILYDNGRFLYHFNRGYRCLAEEGRLKLTPEPPPPAARPPTGAPSPPAPARACAAAADLNADGSLDLAVAFADGEVVAFLNDRSAEPRLWLRLPRGRTGPVTVSVWQGTDHRSCVGTYLVPGHDPPTCATLRHHAACTLHWRFPGRPLQKRVVKYGGPRPTIVLTPPVP